MDPWILRLRNFSEAMLKRLHWSFENFHWWCETSVLRVYEPLALAFKATKRTNWAEMQLILSRVFFRLFVDVRSISYLCRIKLASGFGY